jgi:predicted unusual protein kinase regulating ubiquinone biosynthesis (AarF/ABC1/UbiB family)
VIGTVVIEGIGKTLDPNFEFLKSALPFLVEEKNIRNQFFKVFLFKNFTEKTKLILDYLF